MILPERKKWNSHFYWHTHAFLILPFSLSLFFSSSEHVFEHINTEVLRGPDRHILTNIRAYFGKWWNPLYLKTCWLLTYMLVYVQEKVLEEYTQQLTEIILHVCICWVVRLTEALHNPVYMFLKYLKKIFLIITYYFC